MARPSGLSPQWTPGSQDVMCLVCASPTPNSDEGRPRRYCTDACRQRAWRDRRAAKRAAEAAEQV